MSHADDDKQGSAISGDQEERRMSKDVGRIPSGRFRELGPINWVLAKAGARTVNAPEMHLFTTLGQRRFLFWAWAVYGARLLRGRLPQIDTELVILRVAHLRKSEYELQHHRWIGRRRGLDDATQERNFTWPESAHDAGLTERQRVLLTATDEFVLHRTLSPAVFQQLSGQLDKGRLIEFCLLAGQYDALAATMSALEIPLDNPGSHR
jgi:alkylhydroperoxidase family enzyme